MKSGPVMFLGILVSIAASWLGLIYVPYTQISDVQPVEPMWERPETASMGNNGATLYPRPASGAEVAGRAQYVGNACYQCHSQEIRSASLSGDLARGWGLRPTVPQDFMYDSPPLFGVTRTGPDLANVGNRITDAHLLYRRLFWPKSVSPNSVMPSYRYLFETRKILGQPSDDIILMTAPDGTMIPWDFAGVPQELLPAPGYEIVLTDAAKSLVRYLLSLDHSTPLISVSAAE